MGFLSYLWDFWPHDIGSWEEEGGNRKINTHPIVGPVDESTAASIPDWHREPERPTAGPPSLQPIA